MICLQLAKSVIELMDKWLAVRLSQVNFYYLMSADGFGKPLFDPSLDVGNLIPIVALNCLTENICPLVASVHVYHVVEVFIILKESSIVWPC